MPNPLLKSLAENYNISLNIVEKYWKEAKNIINLNEKDEDYPWGLVVEITRYKLDKHKKEL